MEVGTQRWSTEMEHILSSGAVAHFLLPDDGWDHTVVYTHIVNSRSVNMTTISFQAGWLMQDPSSMLASRLWAVAPNNFVAIIISKTMVFLLLLSAITLSCYWVQPKNTLGETKNEVFCPHWLWRLERNGRQFFLLLSHLSNIF